MHLPHIRLKPTKRIETNFNIAEETDKIEIPQESKDFANEYLSSKKLSDAYDQDLMLAFEREFIFGFDYLHNGEKLLIPEINPVTIFYSNALMSHRRLNSLREDLFTNSPRVNNDSKKNVNPNDFGSFFQLATNCIINLQATIESFSNRLIPEDYTFIGKDGETFEPSLFHKMNASLPEIKERKFKSKFRKHSYIIKTIIELRNEIIHLKPIKENTNTQYKVLYRRLLSYDYTSAIIATKNFVNFYEPNLIEECSCGKEYYYDTLSIENETV